MHTPEEILLCRSDAIANPTNTIPWSAYAARRAISFLSTPIIPKKILDSSADGLSRAKELALEGYGNVFLASHPGQGEIPRLLTLFAEDPILGRKELGIPESVEHIKGWHSNKLTRITVFPIPTEASVEYFATKPPLGTDKKELAAYEKMLRKKAAYEQMLREAALEYTTKHPEKPRKDIKRAGQVVLLENCLDGETELLRRNGMVLIFLQGSRYPYLETITNAVSMLVNRTNRAGFDKYTLTAIGVGIQDKQGKDLTDYTDAAVAGYNIRRRYTFNVGRTFTCLEYQQEAQKSGLTLDELALKQLGLVVPAGYRAPRKTP